ncbi:MAG TPA: hypothetical protein VFJ98_05855 [Mycobacteriales bacterium]|nr:hypothetical protein [Mycobacteriales bacterium]
MTPASLLALLAGNAKVATAVAATAAVTAGGGLAVASAVHAAPRPHATTVTLSTDSSDPETADAGTTDPETTDATDPETTDAGTGTTDPETAEAGDPETTDAGSTDCPAGLKNHGEYVSSVAHQPPADGSAPNAHGKAVSEAAKSDCGKPSKDDATDGSGDPESSDASGDPESSDASGDAESGDATDSDSGPGSHGHGHGQGHGHGAGQAHGHH